MPDRHILIVIATFNEADSLPILVEQLFHQLPMSQILVVDDNSPDGTGHWCDQQAIQNDQFQAIHRAGKQGLGTATILGLNAALDGGFDLVATLDADLSHDPIVLAEMAAFLEEPGKESVGVVIGSRYVSGGRIVGWPWYRRASSYLVNLYARYILKLPTKDNTSAMRVYRTSALRNVDLSWLRCPGYAYLEEILVLLKKSGTNFAELPITFKNRESGESKVNLKELGSSLWEILKLSFRSI